jgi:hypothetical protein
MAFIVGFVFYDASSIDSFFWKNERRIGELRL